MSAFIVSNRNIVIPAPKGAQPCRLARGYMGPVPEWVPGTAYFKALVADGKIVLSQSGKDKDIRKGKASAVKAKKEAEDAAHKAAGEADGAKEQRDGPGE